MYAAQAEEALNELRYILRKTQFASIQPTTSHGTIVPEQTYVELSVLQQKWSCRDITKPVGERFWHEWRDVPIVQPGANEKDGKIYFLPSDYAG